MLGVFGGVLFFVYCCILFYSRVRKNTHTANRIQNGHDTERRDEVCINFELDIKTIQYVATCFCLKITFTTPLLWHRLSHNPLISDLLIDKCWF